MNGTRQIESTGTNTMIIVDMIMMDSTAGQITIVVNGMRKVLPSWSDMQILREKDSIHFLQHSKWFCNC